MPTTLVFFSRMKHLFHLGEHNTFNNIVTEIQRTKKKPHTPVHTHMRTHALQRLLSIGPQDKEKTQKIGVGPAKTFFQTDSTATYNEVRRRYPAFLSPGAIIPSLFSMPSCSAAFDREKSHSSSRLAVVQHAGWH